MTAPADRQPALVRDARPDDRPVLIAFMAALQDYERTLHPNRRSAAAMAEGHLDYLLGMVERHEGFVLVADTDDRPVGFLIGMVDSLEEGDVHIVESERRSGYVSDVFVEEAARGQGLGTRLLAEAERRFEALGLAAMMIGHLDANRSAARLYQRVGFEPYERTLRKPLSPG